MRIGNPLLGLVLIISLLLASCYSSNKGQDPRYLPTDAEYGGGGGAGK